MPKQEILKFIDEQWWNLSPNYTDKEYYCSIEVNRVLELLLEEVKKIK